MDSLDVNSLTPKVHANGLIGQDTVDWDPGVTYANDSSGVLFSGGLWMSGKGPMDSLYASCQDYIGNGDHHYEAGPIADQYDSSYIGTYDRVWSISRDSIEHHANNWWKSGYQAPQMIQEWPGNGDTSNGEAWRLAPFKDLNDNGVYEPQQGDRPIIRGDRAIYFMSNDIAGNSADKNPMGIEVHGMIYAWDCQANKALDHSFFVHYDIINRSNKSYDSVMVGQFADMDIGCANDDHLGTDVERGLMYTYNGDSVDQACNGSGYGPYPPAFGMSFLEGPQVDPNGVDDAFQGPGYGSVNGIGFNDGSVDNEFFGMQHAYYYNRSGYPAAPMIVSEYFRYMRGRWADGDTIWHFGGDGTDTSYQGTRFVFPWDSDPQNFATYGSSHGFWSEDSAGNAPGDRKSFATSGPISAGPGDTLELDLAYVAAQDPDTLGAHAPLDELKARVDTIRQYYMNDAVPCSDGSFSSMEENEASFQVSVFPNPSQGRFKIELKGRNSSYRYELYSMRGELLRQGRWRGSGQRSLRLHEQDNGLYFLRIRSEGESKVLKLMKR
ncbi:MAG: T9SS type A sorting domain-containing protein [Flavobacteriales bacterium]